MRQLQAVFVAFVLSTTLAIGCGGGGDDGGGGCKSDGDCTAGLACCGGACIDKTADEANCGACGTACGAGTTCCAGGCVNTATSAADCGTCGTVCASPNGAPVCAAGACGIGSCNAGFGNCDGQVANGCEVNTTSDLANCGACANACGAVANGTPACAAGACGVGSCNAGFGNCDGQAANGCETSTASDAANCGACANACAAVANGTPACAAGACGVGACNAGFSNCDAQVANGCEVNTTSDAANCGACGTACPAVANGTPGCAASACGIGACSAGFGNCDAQVANGCETNVNTSLSNCGACGRVCGAIPNGTPTCAAGACGVGSCSAGFGNCDAQVANGCETNLNTSANSCGACGRVCGAVPNGTPACAAGTCGLGTCNAGFANCDSQAANGCEVNTNTDARNCGGCGVACGSAAVCIAGACTPRVLIVGAPATPTWNNDVQAKLVAAGGFASVDVFNAASATPTLAQLQGYKAALVYSDQGFADPVALGNVLADYFDAGGRVVVAAFATASIPLQGRWASGAYPLIAASGQSSTAEAGALQLVEPSNPLLAGVASLTATSGYKSTGAVINGGVRVANWGSGAPLIVRGVKNGKVRVDLNFFPPSSSVRADFWVGSGAAIMKNALLFEGFCHAIVGTGGAVCPSRKTQWCDVSNAISATSAAQAKAACDTCYGISCFVETADCSGSAYGPRPAGQYVVGEAYFGYAAGCGGAAGRIWGIGQSLGTLGRWAP